MSTRPVLLLLALVTTATSVVLAQSGQVSSLRALLTRAERSNFTETSRYERDFLISGQVGWQLDPSLAVRLGLFDNTGGIGADYRLTDRILVTGEAFDFGQRRDDNPHLRLYGEYTLRKEQPRTPRLFVTGGVDNALNDTAFTFGGGVRWRDEDLKYLIGSIPIGK